MDLNSCRSHQAAVSHGTLDWDVMVTIGVHTNWNTGQQQPAEQLQLHGLRLLLV